MTEDQNNIILIIGGPDAGKTHFGGQLYGRLQTRTGLYRISSPPEDLTVFKDVLENLNDGKSAGHTNVSANNLLEMQVEDKNGIKYEFRFPDYGGEQVRTIVNDRRINKTWKEQIEKSNAWILFIRLDKIQPIEDIVNRGIPKQEVLENRKSNTEPMIMSSSAFYIELLQMLLYTKRVVTKQNDSIPNLTIVLSCWDLIERHVAKKTPKEILKEKLPATYSYIDSTWNTGEYSVIGLSSTGKTLSEKETDPEYVRKGPENFGYIITSEGKKQQDLTLSIATFIGTKK